MTTQHEAIKMANWTAGNTEAFTAEQLRPYGALLGPGVNAQVRFGQQNGGRHAGRAPVGRRESVEQTAHRLQARRLSRCQAMFTQAGGISQPRHITAALVQIGGQMESLHSRYFSSR